MIQDTIIRLIVIEESANDAEVILSSLRKARFPIRPKHVEDEEDLQDALSEQEWDLLITVPALGDFTVRRIRELVESSNQDIPLVVIAPEINNEFLATLLADGAYAVIPAGNDSSLQVAVRRELGNLEERREKRKLEHLYKQCQQHSKILLETSRDAISYVHDGMHIYANPTYLDMFGYKEMEDLEAMPVLDLVAPDSHDTFKEFMREYMRDVKEEERSIQLTGLRSDKKHFKLKMEVSQALYDDERCIQLVIREETDSSELERKLREQDQLTGLYNRQHFIMLLEKAITKAAESRARGVVLYMVLDNFTKIREQVGVTFIDPIIINVAGVLKKYKKEAYVARFSESTFTLLLMGKDMDYARRLGEAICKQVASTLTEVGEQSVVLTASIGICQVLAAAGTPQNLLNDAHAACRQSMDQGGNRVEAYKAVVKEEAGGMNVTEVAKMIETAFEEKRVFLVYQPVVSLRGETKEMYDVYMRMRDAEGKPIPPGPLFQAAEQAKLTIHLDKWIMKEAITTLQERHKEGYETHLFVRVSEEAVRDETFPMYMAKLLKTAHLPPGVLTVEFSESIAISQMKHLKALITTLHKLECKTALEHFGMSLDPKTSLTHMDVDFVKLDGSYAKGLSSNTENQDKLKALVELAHRQNKPVVAEAVEDANSLTVLFQYEMDFAQGHYIQEPGPDMDYDFEEE